MSLLYAIGNIPPLRAIDYPAIRRGIGLAFPQTIRAFSIQAVGFDIEPDIGGQFCIGPVRGMKRTEVERLGRRGDVLVRCAVLPPSVP